MTRPIARLFAILAAFAIVLGACSGGTSTTSGGSGTPNAGTPVAGGTLCKPGKITKLVAYVRFDGMHNGDPSSADWFYNGKKVYSFPFKWGDGSSRKTAFDLHKASATLDAGRYGIQVRTNARQVGAAAITLKYGSC